MWPPQRSTALNVDLSTTIRKMLTDSKSSRATTNSQINLFCLRVRKLFNITGRDVRWYAVTVVCSLGKPNSQEILFIKYWLKKNSYTNILQRYDCSGRWPTRSCCPGLTVSRRSCPATNSTSTRRGHRAIRTKASRGCSSAATAVPTAGCVSTGGGRSLTWWRSGKL